MASRFAIALGAALLLMLPGGTAFAQLEGADQDAFYADPVLPDPPQKPEHVFSAAIATEDVAAVAPAASDIKSVEAMPAQTARNSKPASGCTAIHPCAVPSPAARS